MTHYDYIQSWPPHQYKQIDMAMKLDHELRLTRHQSWDMQNFEVDLFMMVSRPSKADVADEKHNH